MLRGKITYVTVNLQRSTQINKGGAVFIRKGKEVELRFSNYTYVMRDPNNILSNSDSCRLTSCNLLVCGCTRMHCACYETFRHNTIKITSVKRKIGACVCGCACIRILPLLQA